MSATSRAAAAVALFVAGCNDAPGGANVEVDGGRGDGGGAGDDAPPEFAGAQTAAAASATSIRVGWDPAEDDVTPESSIEYLVYVSTVSGGHDFDEPALTTEPGARRATLAALDEGTEYFIVVRARDLAGNMDDNTVEVSADTSEPDTTPPSFDGIETATAISATSIELSWAAASDDTTSPDDIVYNIYVATSSGGYDFSSAAETTPAGATSVTLGGLSSNESYYFVARAEDLSGNEDDNEVEATATTEAVRFSNDVQPIFTQNCTARACHGSASPKEGLDLTEGAAYENLVEVASEQCATFVRVAPGDADGSYLIRKLTDDRSDCFNGKQMPSSTNPLPAADIEIIRSWIEAGAAND